MKDPFIIYLKNRASLEFEYKRDVASVVRTNSGYQVTFLNGRSYNYGAEKIRYYPLIFTREDVRIYENGKLNKWYSAVDYYGEYLIFRDGDSCSNPIQSSQNIEVCDLKTNTEQPQSIIDYFKEILTKSGGISFDIQSEETEEKNPNQISSEILLKALDKIDISDPRSALSNYLDGVNLSLCRSTETLIYPFGCNESQKLAVETALANSISIVEGPPGTGKTQTILNVIANLIVQNKTVAIVSNNNSAVFNVREKLQKYGYGMVVASLGNNENKHSFFCNREEQIVDSRFELSPERLTEAKDEVGDLDAIVTQCFKYRNKLATLKTELSDTEIEFSHIRAEQPLSPSIKVELDNKFYRRWSYSKVLKLKYLLSKINLEKKLSIINKVRLFLQYGFFARSSNNKELHVYVNHKFYELYIDKIKDDISEIEQWLEYNNEESNLTKFIGASKDIFNGTLYERYKPLGKSEFNADNYRTQFDDFTQHYPVILSSTLSLHTSIPNEYLFDYLIIDESSQVDIIKSTVCFSCCRNAIIVGDSMQLAHIVDENSKEIAQQLRQTYRIAPAYDYVEKNILDSLKCLYGDSLKSVLLKEHYRCHPTIIGFCNKKYYNNNLVIMTSGGNHPFKIIETSISGCRGKYNPRQIDETDLYIRENYSDDYTKVGVIAPFRNHANMLQKKLPDGAEADTIHKFQGREKDTIIFTIVSNQIWEFIDNPNLINVAVSRAITKFVIVKPEAMELPHGTNIGDLIRYICYTTDPEETITKGKICSVFDLLYKEYDKALTTFLSSNSRIRGSAAEIILLKLLTEKILPKDSKFSSIDVVREYKLKDLVRDYELFSEDEVSFIKHNSRLDFLLYSKIDKTPILAIEVDGVSFHNNELQKERDNKKNRILDAVGLPLLRLSTDGYNEEREISENLSKAMGLKLESILN